VAGPSGADHVPAEFTLYHYPRVEPEQRPLSGQMQFG
jgi:hypothetical protein